MSIMSGDTVVQFARESECIALEHFCLQSLENNTRHNISLVRLDSGTKCDYCSEDAIVNVITGNRETICEVHSRQKYQLICPSGISF